MLGDAAQEVDRHGHALGVLAGDAGQAAALAADGNVEGLEALLAQLVQRDVAADLDAVAELGTHLADDVDLGLDDVLLELVAGDTVGEHAAGAVALLEHHGLVALLGQVKSAGQASGTGADDRDLLIKATAGGGGHHGRNIAGVRIQVALGDELLDLVDRDRLVDASAGAGILATAVADAAADGGQRVSRLIRARASV